MRHLLVLIALTLLQAGTLAARDRNWSVEVYLNAGNCKAHSTGMASLDRLDPRVPVTIHFNRTDQHVAARILTTLGFTDHSRAALRYLPQAKLNARLHPAGLSMVTVRGPKGVWDTFPLDSLDARIGWLNRVCRTATAEESGPLPALKDISSFSFGLGYRSGLAQLDLSLNTLWQVKDSAGALTARSRPVGKPLIAEAFEHLDRQLPADSPWRTVMAQDIAGWNLGGLVAAGDSSFDYGVTLTLRFDNKDRRIVMDSIIPALLIVRFRDLVVQDCFIGSPRESVNIDYAPFHMSNQSLISGNVYICPQAKFLNVSGPDRIFLRYILKDGHLSVDGFTDAAYPQALWDADYQYQFMTGALSDGLCAFTSHPIAQDLSTGRVWDLQHILGFRKPGDGRPVERGRYFANALRVEHGVLSLLHSRDKKTYWSRIDLRSGQLIDEQRVTHAGSLLQAGLRDADTAILLEHETQRYRVITRR